MKKTQSNNAFTLLELIIAMVLFAVVCLGIFAINSVLSSNNQDYGQRYLVKSATQTTLNHILNNAALAVGTGATDSNGIYNDLGVLHGNGVQADLNPGMGDANSFCIHQGAGANNNITNNLANDIWLCYTLTNYQLNWCTMAYNTAAANRGAASCVGNANSQYLGAAFNIVPTFTINVTQLLFSITIQNCLNDSATTCFGATPDTVNNPQVSLSGSVIPTQESM